MGAQDRTEKVLREMHVLLSKAEPYANSKVSVIINREEMLSLLKRLNTCMSDMSEEYELTEASRENAKREEARERDEMVAEATKKAEDVYAASIMYSDNALDEVRRIIDSAVRDMDRTVRDMQEKLESQQNTVRQNQSELKSQLTTLHDTDKYMKLIEDENTKKRIADGAYDEDEAAAPAEEPAAKPEIRINTAYFKANGIPLDEDDGAEEDKEEENLISSDDLDAEYFGWQEEQEKSEEADKSKKEGKKSFFSRW